MVWYVGHEENRCTASCWRGKPDSPLARKARCKDVVGHAGAHKDENGNRFTGTGQDAKVVAKR